MDQSLKILSEITIYTKYARYLENEQRRESWNEIVNRVRGMHLSHYPQVASLINDAFKYVEEKKVLPSMRSLQFAGRPIEINPARIFNCCALPIDNIAAFSEIAFLLLSGVGVGFSVQTHHIQKLPYIVRPVRSRRHLIGDSLEGWADAVDVLVKSYFGERASFPKFDFSDIRPKGIRLKTSGGLAPGPEPLKIGLENIQKILDSKQTGEQLTSLEAHDIICHIADLVLAGGIRRSACISLFSFDDDLMKTCKHGQWFEENPQRARANNSAVILRHKITQEEFFKFFEEIEKSKSGEPGFLFSNDQEWLTNPCAETALRPFQMCNLCTINASDITTQEELNARARAAAIIGTIQAGYTDFHYLREIWKKTTDREALIGVSMTGIAGAVLDLNLEEAANIILKTNEEVANLIGVSKAARTTLVKPEGTSSLVVGSSSGIHAWHSQYFIRRMRLDKYESLYLYLKTNLPHFIVDDFFKASSQAVLEIPIKAPDNIITREESAIDLLGRIRYVYLNWIKPGHRKGHNLNSVSATVSIKPQEWGEVKNWLWNNKDFYGALTLLPYEEHTYVQAPFEEIDELTYKIRSRDLGNIDLTKVEEYEDLTNLKEQLACVGGACEI